MTESPKLKELDQLARTLAALKGKGRTIVHCHGVFDLLHPGHIKHFQAARKLGDVLVVTVTPDEYVNKGPGRPVFNQRLRLESIAALECVDYVALNRWPSAEETIRRLKPDIYVKGSDYAESNKDLTGKINDERRAVESVGGRIHFTDEVTFSSTRLVNAFFSVYPEEAGRFLEGFRRRHSAESVIGRLQELAGTRALVIGDAIIDQYAYCQPMGKAGKESVLVARHLSQEEFAGGALACANHLAGFCREVTLVTGLGRGNSREKFIRERLRPNIKPVFFSRSDAPTVVKRRFVEPPFLSKLFEICYLNDANLPAEVEKRLAAFLERELPRYDLVVAADFGHGFITPATVGLLGRRAPFLALNTQTNSANSGYNLVTRYRRADYICVDEPEMRLANQDRFGRLEKIIQETGKRLDCRRIIVTRGLHGSIAYAGGRKFYQVPVFSREVVDRIGAGDAYFSVTAPGVKSGWPMDLVGFVGNAVGALAVRIVGNRSPVEPANLYKFITALLK